MVAWATTMALLPRPHRSFDLHDLKFLQYLTWGYPKKGGSFLTR
jgi:hypothetical protein